MLKKLIEDEGRSHESQVNEMKQKHAQDLNELSQQLEQTKRVRKLVYIAICHPEPYNQSYGTDMFVAMAKNTLYGLKL